MLKDLFEEKNMLSRFAAIEKSFEKDKDESAFGL